MKLKFIIVMMVLMQAVGGLFFVGNIGMSVLGTDRHPSDWRMRNTMEIGAAIALLTGLLMSGTLLLQSQRRLGLAEARLKRASNAFMDVIEDSFETWNLTPAERDVAFLVLKGFSTPEIAGFRKTSEGTVKAQTNAIYRKAGVTGRGQLLSIFIDDLIANTRAAPDEGQQTR